MLASLLIKTYTTFFFIRREREGCRVCRVCIVGEKEEENSIITYHVNDNGVIDGLICIDKNGNTKDWKPNSDLSIEKLYKMKGMSLGARNEIEDWLLSGDKRWKY